MKHLILLFALFVTSATFATDYATWATVIWQWEQKTITAISDNSSYWWNSRYLNVEMQCTRSDRKYYDGWRVWIQYEKKEVCDTPWLKEWEKRSWDVWKGFWEIKEKYRGNKKYNQDFWNNVAKKVSERLSSMRPKKVCEVKEVVIKSLEDKCYYPLMIERTEYAPTIDDLNYFRQYMK